MGNTQKPGLSTVEKIELARQRLAAVTNHLRHVIELHEANEVILYSDILQAQIPQSFAAHAFNSFRDVMFRYSVIRLCALWDGPHISFESVRTVVDLVDDREVRLALLHENCGYWIGKSAVLTSDYSGVDPEIIASFARKAEESLGRRQAVANGRGLIRTIDRARQIIASSRLAGLKQVRDKHLAHSLVSTRAEVKGPVDPARYRDETTLLKETCEVVSDLNVWVVGATFDIENARRIARDQAEALWHGCSFAPLR